VIDSELFGFVQGGDPQMLLRLEDRAVSMSWSIGSGTMAAAVACHADSCRENTTLLVAIVCLRRVRGG